MVKVDKLLEKMRANPEGWRFAQVERILLAHGFVFQNQRGSDRIYKHPSGRRLFISYHGSGPVYAGYVERVIEAVDAVAESEQ
jgi:predicted RNA binding protein YcfA (HicA-like mRNA interferase family)